jgi:hypothetical protein
MNSWWSCDGELCKLGETGCSSRGGSATWLGVWKKSRFGGDDIQNTITCNMALTSRTTACYSRRQWLLRSFIASIGGQSTIQPPPRRRPFSASPRRWNEEARAHSAFKPLNDISNGRQEAVLESQPLKNAEGIVPAESNSDELSEDMKEDEDSELSALEHEIINEDKLEDAAKPPDQDTTIPWYLQPQHQPIQPIQPIQPQRESPVSARQRLPDLPPHPPSILQPLLHHVSIDLGIDDLTLLDLRALDPPPALGRSLLMLLGTARSEKHLHVAADKLCRWLRSEPWKLTPFADGLLGRNELKLKLRRRAKRTRLMAGAGGKSTSDADLEEGLRTGWICVNVGRVEGGELPEGAEQRKAVVGFGPESTGSNVVVQMMTEEKRGELELEGLWMGILGRAEREREKAKSAEAEVEVEERVEAAGEGVREVLEPMGMERNGDRVQRDVGMARRCGG